MPTERTEVEAMVLPLTAHALLIVPDVVMVPPVSPSPATIDVTVPLPLLLNVSQSVSERHPVLLVSEAVQVIAKAPPTAERPAVTVTPPLADTVPVATEATPPFVEAYRRLGAVISDVVARPLHVRVEFEPPTKNPSPAKPLKGAEAERVVVATEPIVFFPVAYTDCPAVSSVVVESPVKERVSPVKTTGHVAARLVSSEISRPDTSAVPTVAHVPAPRVSSTRKNWFVQVTPVYSAVSPPAPVSIRADVRPEKVGLAVKIEEVVEVASIVPTRARRA